MNNQFEPLAGMILFVQYTTVLGRPVWKPVLEYPQNSHSARPCSRFIFFSELISFMLKGSTSLQSRCPGCNPSAFSPFPSVMPRSLRPSLTEWDRSSGLTGFRWWPMSMTGTGRTPCRTGKSCKKSRSCLIRNGSSA